MGCAAIISGMEGILVSRNGTHGHCRGMDNMCLIGCIAILRIMSEVAYMADGDNFLITSDGRIY